MGTYVFRWETSAKKVSVSGSWDDWAHEVELPKENGVFQRQLDLPSAERTYQYKFIVDGKWDFDHRLITEDDGAGNTNNVLLADHIQPLPVGGRSHHGAHENPVLASAAISTVAPGATTTALAGAVPLEKDKAKDASKDASISTVAPGATTAALAGQVPLEKGKEDTEDIPGAFPVTPGVPDKEGQQSFPHVKQPLPAPSSGLGNPFLFATSDIWPEDTPTYVFDADVVARHDDDNDVNGDNDVIENTSSPATGSRKESTEPTFSVNPIPATSGYGNPVSLKPGESVPPASELYSNTVQSTVRDADDTKDFSGINVAGGAATVPHGNDSTRGPFTVPDAAKGIIPESSLPMGDDTKPLETYTGPTISSAGAGTTTADLAGKVPLEPRGTAEVVGNDDEADETAPEGDSKEKSGGFLAAIAAGGAAVAGGAAAIAGNIPSRMQEALSGINNGKDPLAGDDEDDKSKNLAGTTETPKVAAGVPEEVKQSIEKAHESPEAAANPEAVNEKVAVEEELERKVKRTDAGGEPAPTISASQSATAPTAVDKSSSKADEPTIVDADTLPAISLASGAALIGAAGLGGAAVASSGNELKEGETNSHSKTQEFKKDPIGFPSSVSAEKTGDPREASSVFSKDPLGPDDTAHLKSSNSEKDAAKATAGAAGAAGAAGVAAGATAVGGTAVGGASKNDDTLSSSKTANLKDDAPPATSTSTEATDDVLHQKAVASALKAAASSPAQTSTTSSSATKDPAVAAARKATETSASAATVAAGSQEVKTQSTPVKSNLNKPFHGRSVSITQDDASRDVSPMTRETEKASGAASIPTVTTGVSGGTTSTLSQPPDTPNSKASTFGTTDGSPSSSKEKQKKNRRSFLQRVKQAFHVHPEGQKQ